MTIKDVATRAHVSVTTVSKALNNYSDVNPATREKIKRIAQEMGYTPNPIASTLVRRESQVIGFFVSSLPKNSRTSMLGELLSGIFESITTRGYEVMLIPLDRQLQRKKSFTKSVQDYRFAGTVLQGLRMDDRYYTEVTGSEVPGVMIDMPAQSPLFGSVMSDNEKASREGVAYMISRGHRRIAHVAGTAYSWVASVRIQGYRNALEEAGIGFDPGLVLEGQFQENDAFEAVDALLTSHPGVTAFSCASDVMALGVIRAARKHGRRIPEDLVVVGFDDVPWAPYVTPSLTTIRQDFHALGYAAARMLHTMIRTQSQGHTEYVPHELVIRDSTG